MKPVLLVLGLALALASPVRAQRADQLPRTNSLAPGDLLTLTTNPDSTNRVSRGIVASNLPPQLASLAAAASPSTTNTVYAATDAAWDGVGSALSPRAVSSQASLSNLVWRLPNGTKLVVSGPPLAIVGDTNSTAGGAANHITGAIKLVGKSDITISGLRLTQANYADTVLVSACTNIVFEDCVFRGVQTHTAYAAGLQGVINIQSPSRNIKVLRSQLHNFPNHGIVHWGGDMDHDGLVVFDNDFYGGGNTNHPSLGVDGAAVVVSGSLGSTIVSQNRFHDCLRPIELYSFGTFTMAGIQVRGNMMTNVQQLGICAFSDGTNWMEGVDVSGNSIYVRNASLSSGGISGINMVAAMRGLRIIGNHIQSSPVPAGGTSAKIAINVSAAATGGGRVQDVVVSGNIIAGTWSQRGIQIYGKADGTGGSFTTLSNYVVNGNVIGEATTGLLLGGDNGTVGFNTIKSSTFAIDVQNARNLRLHDNSALVFGTAVNFSDATTTNVFMSANSWSSVSVNNTVGAVGVVQNEQSPYSWLSGGGATLTNGGVILSGGPQILSASNNVAPNGSILLNSDGRLYLRTNGVWLLK